MKRLVVALGLVLVMAFSLPAAAGINTEIGGKVQTDLYYNEKDGLWAYGEVAAKITMSAGTDGAVKAVLGLGATEAKSDGEFGDDDGSKLTKRSERRPQDRHGLYRGQRCVARGHAGGHHQVRPLRHQL